MVLWNTLKKLYRGEFFDLTITSFTNLFGKSKIETSYENGIYFPIDYYIEELTKIVNKEKDDKTDKRYERKYFLQTCNMNDDLKKLFDYLIAFLNGEKNNACINNDQPLIAILAGGNIISIYRNLLKIIFLKVDKRRETTKERRDDDRNRDLRSQSQSRSRSRSRSPSRSSEDLCDDKNDKGSDNATYMYTSDEISELFNTSNNKEYIKKLICDLRKNISLINELITYPDITAETDNVQPKKFEQYIQDYSNYSDLDFNLLPNIINDFWTTDFWEQQHNISGGTRELEELKQATCEPTESRRATLERKKLELQEIERKRIEKEEQEKIEKQNRKNELIKKKKAEAAAAAAASAVTSTPDIKKKTLLKKITNQKDSIIITHSEDTKNLESGFFLCRIKSSFRCDDAIIKDKISDLEEYINDLNETHSNNPSNCNKNDLTKLNITFDKLIPQLANQNWTSIPDISDKCKSYIKKLLAKKKFTSTCTDTNTEIISKTNKMETFKKDNDEFNQLKNMIDFISTITYTINHEVLNLKSCRHLISKMKLENLTLFDIFYSLDSIINSCDGELLKIVKRIVEAFYNLEDTQNKIANIVKFYDVCTPDECQSYFYLAPEFKTIRDKISKILQFSPTIINDPKFKGTIITANLIKSSNEDTAYLDDFDEDELEQLEKEAIQFINEYDRTLSEMESDLVKNYISKRLNSIEDDLLKNPSLPTDIIDKYIVEIDTLHSILLKLEDDMDIDAEGLKKKIKKRKTLNKIKKLKKRKTLNKIKKLKKIKTKKKIKKKKTKKKLKKFIKKIIYLTKKCKKKKHKKTRKCKKFLKIIK